jgi:hypothetical protein
LPHLNGRMTESAAIARCAADATCVGFTYNSGSRGRAKGEEEMLFKSSGDNAVSRLFLSQDDVSSTSAPRARSPAPPQPLTLTNPTSTHLPPRTRSPTDPLFLLSPTQLQLAPPTHPHAAAFHHTTPAPLRP